MSADLLGSIITHIVLCATVGTGICGHWERIDFGFYIVSMGDKILIGKIDAAYGSILDLFSLCFPVRRVVNCSSSAKSIVMWCAKLDDE